MFEHLSSIMQVPRKVYSIHHST